jgi:hypothetical protein
VLPILRPARIRHETVNPPATSEPEPPSDISAKKAAGLRTLIKYGMSVSQAAAIYGVPVETIARILQKA